MFSIVSTSSEEDTLFPFLSPKVVENYSTMPVALEWRTRNGLGVTVKLCVSRITSSPDNPNLAQPDVRARGRREKATNDT